MKNNTVISIQWLLGVGAVLTMGAAGCTDRNNNGQPDGVSQTEIDKTVNKVEQATENAVTAAKPAVNNAVSSAETLTENAAATGKIKTAFIADPDLKARNINVTSNSQTKTVLLQGTVATAAHKSKATRIARENAPDFKIANQLKVAVNPNPSKPAPKKQPG